jgi:hypothetical protein
MYDYEPKDVYNMDESGLSLRTYPNKTLAQGKVKGQKLHKERVTFALVVNSNGIDKLKLLMIHTSKQP